jgi:outer membrane protein TolC
MPAHSRISSSAIRSARPLLLIACFTVFSSPVTAQLSLTSAADLALRHSPQVQMAQASVDKARAGLAQAKDVFIPTVTGGSGLGYSYGFPIGQPSVFNFQAQSLVFNSSQFDYIRAARSGLDAATLSLMDARQSVAADAALAYIAVQRDQQRDDAIAQESADAQHLETIVEDRANAGQDSSIDLTTAKLTLAQLRVDALHASDESLADRAHFARLLGFSDGPLKVSDEPFPPMPPAAPQAGPDALPISPGIRAAYAQARAAQQVAHGDARYLFRPQIAFGAEYDRFTKYNNYDLYYQRFQSNNAEIGIQIKVPIFDRGSQAKAHESAAEASRLLHNADMLRDQFLDGRITLSHSATELRARAEVAKLEQQLAQQQLEAMSVRVNTAATNGAPQMTPKDEQNARIAERQKYLAYINATYELEQAEINLLRQNGSLEPWLKSAAAIKSQPNHTPQP